MLDARRCSIHDRVSIRAPREGGDSAPPAYKAIGKVSIRAPREGGDFIEFWRWSAIRMFQSAPPVKGAISSANSCAGYIQVSIRAPREGGDFSESPTVRRSAGFNPRPP